MSDLERNPEYPQALQDDILALGRIALIEPPRVENREQAWGFLEEHNVIQVLYGAISRNAKDGRQIEVGVGSMHEPINGYTAFHFHAFNIGEHAVEIRASRDSMSGLTSYNYTLSLDDNMAKVTSPATGNLERGSGIHASSVEFQSYDDPLENGDLLPLLVKDAAFDMIGALQLQA